MGTVWRARDIALHREVALKEVRPPDPATGDASSALAQTLRDRAIREARALARLAHPHVVTIHHIVEPLDGSHPGSSWSWCRAARCTTGSPTVRCRSPKR